MTVLIRAEVAADIPEIHSLTHRAFADMPYSDGTEADLNDALRAAGVLVLSLVAEDAGAVVGHVAFTAAVSQTGETGWFVLGPIAVEPQRQGQGIGGQLIRAGLARLAELDARGCILIGDTGYYPRHGFVPRPDLAPPGEPAEHYMVLAFGPEPSAPLGFHPLFHSIGADK